MFARDASEFLWFFKPFYYTLSVCHIVVNVRDNSIYISATRQRRDFGFSLKDLLLSDNEI